MQETLTAPQYARFSRRVRALLIDWVLSVGLIIGALFVAASAGSDSLPRVLGIVAVILLLLYEPVLVSATGGTIGHYYANIRVVDNRHHGNISFLKAVARFFIKSVLGWFSFIFMTATRRNQALHDQLTQSSVQMRDPAKALPDHYIAERTELTNPNLPSRARRSVVILMYLFLIFATFNLVLAGGFFAGLNSEQCFYRDSCSYVEHLFNAGITLLLIAASACFIGLGWRGKLAGARSRA
jgi:hypothetical protein